MILNRQRTVRIARPALESFLHRLLRRLRLGKAEVAIALVTDAEIARMNRAYRKKKGPTDVLSFPSHREDARTCPLDRSSPARVIRAGSRSGGTRAKSAFTEPTLSAAGPRVALLSPSTPRTRFLGDIAISPVTARRNARSAGRPLTTELRILMLHGILHLLGYDHETDSGQMDRLEQTLRQQLGLA